MSKNHITLPLIDNPLWDEQHAVLVEHYGDLLDALDADDQIKAVTAFKRFIRFNSLHFEWERAQMEGTGFPFFRIHTADHHLAELMLEGVLDRIQTAGLQSQKKSLVEDIPEWFKTHIDTMDRISINHVTEVRRGADPQSLWRIPLEIKKESLIT